MKKVYSLLAIFALLFMVACEGIRPAGLQNGVENPGSDREVIVNANASPYRNDGTGAFRINCFASHFNYSDPILYPGQAGASHLHSFFGNSSTNAYSTAESIAQSGNSTCTGGTANRTAYWVPSLIDTSDGNWEKCMGTSVDKNCKLIVPGGDPAKAKSCAPNDYSQYCVDQSNAMQIYYKTGYRGINPATVKNWPVGLRMIAGNSRSTSAQPTNVAWWTCKPNNQGEQGPAYTSIEATNCRAGQLLVQAIEFPQCWDGRNLDSPDHKSHMAYGAGWPDKGCPSSHPVPLAEITVWTYYRLPEGINLANLRLSSDMYNGPGGYSNHSDWMNGWNQDVFQLVVDNCLTKGLDCQMNLLGNGKALGGITS